MQWRIKLLVLIFAIVQFCAQFWYLLTYIPYGRCVVALVKYRRSSLGLSAWGLFVWFRGGMTLQ